MAVDKQDIYDICNELEQKFVTGPVTLTYPKLCTPDYRWDDRGTWVATSIMEPGPAAEFEKTYLAIRKEAAERIYALLQADKPKKKIERKLADPSYSMVEDDEGEETGDYKFNFKLAARSRPNKKTGKVRSFKPTIELADGTPVKVGTIDPWSGTTCRVSFFMVPFHTPKLGVGVSLKLRGLRILDLATGIGEDQDLGFGDGEEGFGSDDFTPTEPAVDNGGDDDDEEEGSSGSEEGGSDEEDEL